MRCGGMGQVEVATTPILNDRMCVEVVGRYRGATVRCGLPEDFWVHDTTERNSHPFRVAGKGRCEECEGRGYVGVFSATHGAPCPSCSGRTEAE